MSAQLGDFAKIDGRAAEVISINDGNREITFQFLGSEPCPHCGREDRASINEGTPLWNERVRPVSTCGVREEAA